MFKKKNYVTEKQLNHITNLIHNRLQDVEINAYNRFQIQALESKIKVLQELVVKAGLVEEYQDPIKKGNTVYRLGESLYTLKKGK